MSYATTTYTNTNTTTSIFTNDSTATITFTNTNPVTWLLTLKQGTDTVRKRGVISQLRDLGTSQDGAVKRPPANPDAEW